MISVSAPRVEHLGTSARLIADVRTDDEVFPLWFETDEEYAHGLCADRSDAFVAALLPSAMCKGEDIVCEAPVSAMLLYALREYLIPTLARYTMRYGEMAIDAPVIEGAADEGAGEATSGLRCTRGVATGFSGGADCMYTVLRHRNRNDRYRLTHLALFNAGAFEGTDFRGTFRAQREKVREIARELGLGFVSLDTNLAEAFDEHFLSVFTYRNITCALALQNMFETYLISSSYSFEHYGIHGENSGYSDLLSTALFSTELLTFYPSGGALRRIDKLAALADAQEFYRDRLHVCTRTTGLEKENCGLCGKCIRTELALEKLGVLDRFDKAFPLDLIAEKHDDILLSALLHVDNPHYAEAIIGGVPEHLASKLKHMSAAQRIAEKNRDILERKLSEGGAL